MLLKNTTMKKLKLTIVFILFLPFSVSPHPDGATPYWYPSSFIFGYVTGCADQIEKTQTPITKEFWPEEIRSICSCVVDAFRHSITYQEIIDNATDSKVVAIATTTLPVCANEELAKKGSKNG